MKGITSGSLKSKVTSSDLQEERQKCNFNSQELTEFVFGGKERLNKYLNDCHITENDDVLRNTPAFYDMTREELSIHQKKKLLRLAQLKMMEKLHFKVGDWAITNGFQGLMPNGLHSSMWLMAIEFLTDEEQHRHWIPLTNNLHVHGCYAQTELGHGSYVQGLETTATFDKERDEFVIHSPTISSTKFLPGDLGLNADHAVVFAQLLLNGKRFGVHPFIVQLRDQKTHELLPGREGGDCGPKFGYNSKENGFMRFTNVRIPRRNMLMKFVEVDREGNFNLKGDLRILYTVMQQMRLLMIYDAHKFLSKGLTIAGRYAAVRRQFATLEDKKIERKLIDYQTHMHKIAPLVAYAYAMSVSTQKSEQIFLQLQENIKKQDFGLLDLLHHLTSGFKAVYSTVTYEGLDTLRQACGGAGYLAWSGLPSLQHDYSASTTVEGDNTVMLQQAARLLLKNSKNVQKGMAATGFFDYLNSKPGKSSAKSVEDFLTLDNVQMALEARAGFRVKDTSEKIESSPQSQNEKLNWLYAVDVIAMTQAHIQLAAFRIFREYIEKKQFKCTQAKAHLTTLCILLGVYELSNDRAALLESGHFDIQTVKVVDASLKKLYAVLRPQIIPLIEALGVHEAEICSSIGNKYGDIYEWQLELAKSSRMNQRKDGAVGYREYVQPIVLGKL